MKKPVKGALAVAGLWAVIGTFLMLITYAPNVLFYGLISTMMLSMSMAVYFAVVGD